MRVAEIDGAGHVIGRAHEPGNAFDHVVHETERTSLLTVTVKGDIFPAQGLDHKIGNYPSVIGKHARAISIENPRYTDGKFVLTVIIKEQGLSASFAFIVTGTGSDGVDPAAICLVLGMNLGITIDLTGGGLKNSRACAFGKPQHVDGAVNAGLGGLHGIVLVMNGRGRTGQIIYLVHFHIERKGHVMAHQFEMGVGEEMLYIVLGAGEEVVHAEHVIAVVQQPLAQVGSKESRPTRNQNPFL